jgi:hypothetical protein
VLVVVGQVQPFSTIAIAPKEMKTVPNQRRRYYPQRIREYVGRSTAFSISARGSR